MKLSERMRNRAMSAWEYADEVAQLEAENEALREVFEASKDYFILDPKAPLTEIAVLKKKRLQESFVRAYALLKAKEK